MTDKDGIEAAFQAAINAYDNQSSRAANRDAMRAAISAYLAALPSPPVAGEVNWQDDPASDERWNAGVNFANTQLCNVLGVDPKAINWDAATETLDGDVSSVIFNAIRAAYGDGWSAKPETTARIRSALEPVPAAPVQEAVAWLLERADSDTAAPWYWAAGQIDPSRSSAWTQNHMAAIRFARREDAQAVADRLMRKVPVEVRVCEHRWSARAIAAPDVQEVEAWPGRKFCETAERNVASLAEYLDGADDKEVARDAALAIRTLLAAPSVEGAMDGWKLVPVEPTLAMSLAGETEYTRKGLGVWSDFHGIYRAMIAATPSHREEPGI